MPRIRPYHKSKSRRKGGGISLWMCRGLELRCHVGTHGVVVRTRRLRRYGTALEDSSASQRLSACPASGLGEDGYVSHHMHILAFHQEVQTSALDAKSGRTAIE